ncbi:fungal-specific transcription factor domain-containing protein [Neohortaea acidophila]|uniref:Fungal-specific transcription factor domain-containing protein n=1 Tax=Neohortaea acidophila TaxID=245834 RepID=A0A6A6PT61_9PEZI|nr:fungal-specific transcription factor domain-containing protein [Neohortaea acidophila]KAF2482956.1 fungal-specific transcription factor domain-containing protein [Neohortaea acidophila]
MEQPTAANADSLSKPRKTSRRKHQEDEDDDGAKRRCISSACVACRARKSKCDGKTPACAACAQIYGTACVYDPNSDHRRKGVYKHPVKSKNTTLDTLVQALLNLEEDEAIALVREMRQCDSLDLVAERIAAQVSAAGSDNDGAGLLDSSASAAAEATFETQLAGRIGDLRLDDGTVRYIGGTSHLIHLDSEDDNSDVQEYHQQENATASWTTVTSDTDLIDHLLTMYFAWHYPFFTCLPKDLFFRDFLLGNSPSHIKRKNSYCTSLLVNVMLAIGCHFTSRSGARENPDDPATAGDHFFKEAKRLIMEHDEHERPCLTNIQAFALMSVREVGCGRESKGWVYSGMAFRLAQEMGLPYHIQLTKNLGEAEQDARRITFWGCYQFDACHSNYLGRLPQLPNSMITVHKIDAFPNEEAEEWTPYTDSGTQNSHSQPARYRAVALHITKLCEISNDIMLGFYNPSHTETVRSRAAELKKLSALHIRLEDWRRELPKELEAREGALPSVLIMHMFCHLLFINLFRPFLRYSSTTSPLPPSVNPRKHCTQAAAAISRVMRFYKRSFGLRRIPNICIYILYVASTIHLLNLPQKDASKDLVHAIRHLEEISDCWPAAKRSLAILSALSHRWKVQVPEAAHDKFEKYQSRASPSPALKQRQAALAAAAAAEPSPTQLAEPLNWADATLQQLPSVFASGAPLPLTDVAPALPQVSAEAYSMLFYNHNTEGQAEQVHQVHTAAQQQPQQSQITTPQTTVDSRPFQPSTPDMFGGVQQLLREGQQQDWTFRDPMPVPAELGSWAGNWSTMIMDPSMWADALAPENGSGAAMAGNIQPAVHVVNAQASAMGDVYQDGGATATNDGEHQQQPGVVNWLNEQMGTYDESAWYG